MASGRLPVECKAQRLEAFYDLSIKEMKKWEKKMGQVLY
jgi:hypothetical protein